MAPCGTRTIHSPSRIHQQAEFRVPGLLAVSLPFALEVRQQEFYYAVVAGQGLGVSLSQIYALEACCDAHPSALAVGFILSADHTGPEVDAQDCVITHYRHRSQWWAVAAKLPFAATLRLIRHSLTLYGPTTAVGTHDLPIGTGWGGRLRFTGMSFGAISPTDVDLVGHYGGGNVGFNVLGEIKFGPYDTGKQPSLPRGQRLFLERLAVEKSKTKPTLLLALAHSQHETALITQANSWVTHYWVQGWRMLAVPYTLEQTLRGYSAWLDLYPHRPETSEQPPCIF